MKASIRHGTALCAIAAFGLIAGCASPDRSIANFAGRIERSNIGLATRAQAALMANRTGEAVTLAERAVANSPRDAGFRGLLGNIYLASGRFSSAASAFRDSLTLIPQQAPVVLKLALAEIALGRPGEAIALLDAARPALDSADYGLAMALAGNSDAVSVLDQAARQPGADGRVRQNLALAYALAGDWVQARTIAAQDLPADQLEQRIAQWTQLTAAGRPADRIAALIGITPAIDSGMPVRLALAPRSAPSPFAAVTVQRAPEPAAAQSPPVAAAVQPAAEPVAAQVSPAIPTALPLQSAFDQPAAAPPSARAQAVVEAMPAVVEQQPEPARTVATSVSQVGLGRSASVVQLGAYGSLRRVESAWNDFSQRFAVLRDYVPASARIESALGTLYRLSVRGFGSEGEAVTLCGQLRLAGGSCFVRTLAGDEPVRLASR